MKCAIHANQDAIGVCNACGGGVCPQCQQRIGGIFFCLPCLDAGRYRPSLGTQTSDMGSHQVPTGFLSPFTRALFIIGIIAMGIMIVGFYLIWCARLVPSPSNVTNVYKTMGLAFIALAITLTGITFFGLFRYYNSFLALSVSLFSLLSGWLMVVSDLLLYNPDFFVEGWYNNLLPGPLFPQFQLTLLAGYIFWAITFIVWAILFLHTRHFLPSSKLAIAASICYLVMAHVIILFQIPLILQMPNSSNIAIHFIYMESYFIAILAVAEAAAILSAILFYQIRKKT